MNIVISKNTNTTLVCSICSKEYNHITRIPRILPNCSHSFCSVCLQKLIVERDYACPIDKKNFDPIEDINDLPINVPLQELIERVLKQRFCVKHKEEANLICLTDKMRICSSCEHSPAHKFHEIKHMKKAKFEATKKIEDFEALVDQCTRYPRIIGLMLDMERKTLTETIQRRFVILKEILNKKEKLLIKEVDDYIKAQKDKMDVTIKFDEILKEKAKEKIQILQNEEINEKYLKILEEEVIEAKSKLELILLKNHYQNFGRFELERKLDSFQINFRARLIKLCLPFSSKDFYKSMENNYVIKKNDQEIFKTSSLVELAQESNKLSVSLFNYAKSSEIPLKKLKEVTEVELDLTDYSLISSRIKWNRINFILACLWQRLGRAIHLTLKIHAGPTHPRELMNLFCYCPWTDKRLRIRCEIVGATDEKALACFTSYVLPRIYSLKEIHFHMKSGIKATDKSLELLTNYNTTILKNLENFYFCLDNSPITDQSLIKLLYNLSAVRVFKLHLWKTRITDKSLQKLGEDILPQMKSLVSFELSLIETQVTDQGVVNICVPMEGVKSYKLYLGHTRITMRTVEALVKNLLPTMRALECFELSLKETLTVNESVVQLLRGVKPLIYFKLYLATGHIIQSQGELEKYIEDSNKGFFAKLFKI